MILATHALGCGVGGETETSLIESVSDGCSTDDDYASCTTGDDKPGYCVPQRGCSESCDDVSTICWNFTYVWTDGFDHDPLCYCADDEWLAPSQR